MDTIIFTPRLKLTLLTKAERGSPELEWLHKLHSNEESTFWSIHARSQSIEDTDKGKNRYLPKDDDSSDEKTYRVIYAVHKILNLTEATTKESAPTEFIGCVNLKGIEAGALPLPEELVLPASASATTLTVEVAYMFLPDAWGCGYATESVNAMFEASKRARGFWAPFQKLYVRAVVDEAHAKSQRVLDKTGMVKKGVYSWSGDAIFVAGEWHTQARLVIYGLYLFE